MEKDTVKEFQIELLKTLHIFYSGRAAQDRFIAIMKFLEDFDYSKELNDGK